MNLFFLTIVITIALRSVLCQNETSGCNRMYFNSDSFVCLCDLNYCDFIGEVGTPEEGAFIRYISSRDEFRFHVLSGVKNDNSTNEIKITIDHDYEYQTMIGFGGAFTDSTGINVASLPETLQDTWIKSYFSKDGIEYDLCRIPIAGSDFSTYPYTYDEFVGDVDLVNFSLTEEDFLYKIPLIQRAIEVSPRNIRLFGSPWSPPPWMKENGMHNGTGGLLREMWDPFANYLVKFVEEYESHGLNIWGITPQNEPLSGFQDWPWNACAWSKTDMRDWIKTSMGPIFEAANLRRLKVMVLDHNRLSLPDYPASTLEDPEASQYVDGTAIHWYNDNIANPLLLTEMSSLFPDKFLLYTESCEGWDASEDERVLLGSWQRAEHYAQNILEDVNHQVGGWVDWNMALDLGGGPNWASNFVDSPTIVDATMEVFYKQPMFYAMGHFSKFLKEGSVKMYTNVEGDRKVKAAAFHSPDGEEEINVIIILNESEEAKKISVSIHSHQYINVQLYPKSIETILFK